jgi:hypothetical protein
VNQRARRAFVAARSIRVGPEKIKKKSRHFLDDRDLAALTFRTVVHQASPSTFEWTSSEEGTMPAKKTKKVAKKPVKKAAKKKTSKK